MVRFLVLGTLGVALYAGLVLAVWNVGTTTYDCSLASFHPDYPAKVRKACREAAR